MPIFEPEFECMPVDELKILQLYRLKKVLRIVYENVKPYRKKMDERGIKPDDIKSLENIKYLPFTTKDDFRENYPYGLFAVPMEKIVRIHSSSGTTGKPTVVGYTKRDLETWSTLTARVLSAGGVTSRDVVHIAFGYGLFTGGFGLHYGAEKIGASVIPVSSGQTKRQIMIMKDYGSTALVCTPSYALHIAEVMKEMGVDKSELKLKYGLFGAEPWTESMRREIETRLGIEATDNYGLSEVMGPGVSYECLEAKSGLHIAEDHFLVEVIDPETEEQLPEGEWGELVITTLTKEALPLIRYRTRDITKIYREKCSCGRTLIKMAKPSGRTDDMIIVRGVNIFPSQVEEALLEISGVSPHYVIVVDRKDHLDELEVWVEAEDAIFFDSMRKQKEMIDKITEHLTQALGVKTIVKLVEPKTLERSMGKAKRVVDRRDFLKNYEKS
ncbi:MAG: phenylacetate--CoA ligase family protein [Thermosulfidibacteraceae bacterium]|jgi:phenylacetate-CoA ligase